MAPNVNTILEKWTNSVKSTENRGENSHTKLISEQKTVKGQLEELWERKGQE